MDKYQKACRHHIIYVMTVSGLSSNCIIEDLWALGIAYRRGDMLRDIRKIRLSHATS